MYFNTTKESGKQLELFKKKTDKQDVLILAEFTKNLTENHSPSSLYRLFDLKGLNWPITSIRRSLNTLYNNGDGKIELLGKRKSLISDRNEFYYKLKI